MDWAEGFIAVDWGTTNRRGYAIASDGRMTAEHEDGRGILSVAPGDFGEAVAELVAKLGDRPLLLAGMVGSNRGWREARYVGCPAGLGDLVHGLAWVEPGRIAIVPGVKLDTDDAADVMRGEEVQILGAHAAGMIGDDALVCHPGTHNKWIQLAGGRIATFRTIMTGELFNLLRTHSILADLLAVDAGAGRAFTAGVEHGLAHDDLAAELFAVRARYLLGKAPKADAAPYTSGLLIGGDVKLGLRSASEGEVVVMGRPSLTSLYALALDIAGRRARRIDGEEAFLAGARHIVEMIR